MKVFGRTAMLEAFAQVCALAEGQRGYLALVQLPGQVSEQYVAQWQSAGVVEPVTDEVIRVRAGGVHPHPRLYASWLSTDSAPASKRSLTTLAVSHQSAAQLYGAGSVSPPSFELTGQARQTPSAEVTIHEGSLRADECRVVEGLPVTTPARTLADLADGQGFDLSDLGRLARSFIAQGWTTADELGAELTEQFAGRDPAPDPLPDGPAWLAAALDAAAAG